MSIEKTECTLSVWGFTKGEKEGFFCLVIAKDSWGSSPNSPFNHLQASQAKRNINRSSLSSFLTPTGAQLSNSRDFLITSLAFKVARNEVKKASF